MRVSWLRVRVRRGVHRSPLLQIGLVVGFWLAGEGIAKLTGLPVPGGVIGMLLVLALLATRRVSAHSLRRGAEWFIGSMVLFFVPAVMALLDHRELLGLLGLKILAVIVGGTVAVMLVTGLIVDLCTRWGARDAAAHASGD
ncbi:holin-like protein [Enhydrobacter aerosaccus]|uniref:Holin-like protein n=1 Tax=Enhydrobacter aerosaccus TaxID=225324 RepID=A0A1T4LX35_9HYPH|nr:CidA/LrgA family protein [Enhydrobacter aerosaccus]SJZ59309.1 holin-like protein [Enhydrobacter aerosaccus]